MSQLLSQPMAHVSILYFVVKLKAGAVPKGCSKFVLQPKFL